MNITYTNTISPEDYNMLRESVGWRGIKTEQAKRGLAGTRYLAAARDGEKTVGMGRVISDGGYVCYLADVIVKPEYQGKGIGKAIMSLLVSQVKEGMEDGEYIDFVMMSAKGKEPFYEKFGFGKRPTESLGHGMGQWIEK